MRVGLEKIPKIKDLEEAYNWILYCEKVEKSKIDLNHFSTLCQWIRFDSRLGEICVKFLSDYWKQINPIHLRDAFVLQPWPAVLGVLLEFCDNKSKLFQLWKKTATDAFEKANWEQFFIGKRRIGGQSMLDDARFSLEQYKQWGYLAREILINKAGRVEKSYSPETRMQILRELAATHSRITTELYWEAIAKSVSKRQAERDLLSARFLRARGSTKGRYFVA